MHKKLASELTSLAHSILQMKNKDDVFALKEKAYEVYEKLSVLAYIEEYINTTPQATETKEELLAKVEEAEKAHTVELSVQKTELIGDLDEEETQMDDVAKDFADEVFEKIKDSDVNTAIVEELADIEPATEEIIGELDEEETQMNDFADDIADDVFEKIEEENVVKTVVEEIVEQPFEELEDLIFGSKDNEKFDETKFIEDKNAPTLEEELKNTLSVDEAADLFTKVEEPKKSLNDRLQNTIQIGLNDRIAFVKHLFDGDSGDFNRVVSQLNTFDNEKDAKKFINKTVKPDYDWNDKEEYETRFIEIIERKFA